MGNTDILVANVTATLKHDGRRFYLVRGKTLVRADDPIVKGHESMFEPLRVDYLGAPVEQATAAPGEKRTVQPGAGMPAEVKSRARRKPADTAKD
jgi:hypothetical protein